MSIMNGSHSVGGASVLVQRLREKKRSWEPGKGPEPDSIDDHQFQELVKDFRGVSDVAEINLIGNGLGDTIISALGRAMEEVPFVDLRSLQLGGNYITAVGIRAIARAISIGHLPALESLGLFPQREPNDRQRFSRQVESNWDRNQIKDIGLKILAVAFAAGNSNALKFLNLEHNGFSPEGAKEIAREIREGHLPSLEAINLSYNDVGDEGIRAIAKAFMESGNNLKVLDLETCNIYADGTKALATAFMSGNIPGLTELYLKNNDMGRSRLRDISLTTVDEGLMELARVLQNGQLPKLQMLDLEHNVGGSKKVAEAFRHAVRSNKSLVLTLKINWPSFAAYEHSVRRYLERNRRIARILEQLQGEEDMQATNGKIFLCGDPREGKTTLRRSLQNNLPPIITRIIREKRFREEPRTRGIEVSHIVSKEEGGREPIKLAIWDLAGQSEYQVLHSAFLPDLAFADGLATTFVIVCNAKYPSSDTGGQHHGRQVLNYWMRFIASSSLKGVETAKRHVVIVLNRFDGEPCEYLDQWVQYLKELKELFQDYLKIKDTPFVLDARVARLVSPLREYLIQHTRVALQKKKVPKICQFIQDRVREDVKTMDFPVVPWAVFAAKFESSVSENKLKAAVDYLHEAGHLIHFREGWEGTIHGGLGQVRSLVVLDPDWFCRRVVGQLLLPDNSMMLADKELPLTRKVHPDGSVALMELKNYFHHVLRDKQQVDDIVAMLLRLGICYMAGSSKVLIPALISDLGNLNPTSFWSRSHMVEARDQWVMGYGLKVQYRATTLLPIAVFRRLQVELALDPMCAGDDSGYQAGKLNISFGTNGMAVMVEFSAHEQDPNLEDRVDILVRPLMSREYDMPIEKRRELQVELAESILERFVYLAETCSPGVEFVRLVVKPWRTVEGLLPMERRNATWSVEKVKTRVQAGQMTTAWAVGGEPVKLIDLLSGTELRGLETLLEEKCELAEKLIVDLGVAPAQQASAGNHSGEVNADPLIQIIVSKLDDGFGRMDSRMDELQRTLVDVRSDLGKVLSRQKKVLKKLQALERFSRDEVRNSVPRFMYLTKPTDDSGIWIALKDMFVQSVTLHFLCEARYNDHSLHVITGQEGVEIRNLSKVAAKVVPWLAWSFKVAIVVSKAASQAFLPGLVQLIQTVPPSGAVAQDVNISAAIAYLFGSAIMAAGDLGNLTDSTVTSSLQNGNTPVETMEVKDGLKEVLTELIGKELRPTEFQSKFNLKRAVENESGNIVWVCHDCFGRYQRDGTVEAL